ncbi:MAG: TonB-dependent receptor [Candidatus Marinimicrobia bacterium]|nr:TonB-dependent receptor [Candidatus Neomarinimicrobiota bacterium]
MKNITKLILMLSIMLISSIYAGTTGKISGTVKDKKTGEFLVGCNIMIDGTSLGAATDIHGNYYILNVPPGKYTVRSMMIGFTTVRMTEVDVAVDLTTRINFSMSMEAIEGEEVVVVAKRQTVRLDQTSMASIMDAKTLENLPVAEVIDAISLQAGIVRDGGGLHVRGGRSGEVSFWVDGISTTDSYDGSSVGEEIQNSSIQELQVISGTFNAEYGNAMSGIVNIVTKDGQDHLEGGLEIYGGGFHTLKSDIYTISSPFSIWKSYEDLNGDGQWDSPEWFNDLNGNLQWDYNEPYDDANENGIFDAGEPLNNDLGTDGLAGDPMDNGSMIPSYFSNNNGQKNEPSLGEGDGQPQWGEHRFSLDNDGFVDKLNVVLNPFQIKNINAHLSGPVPFLNDWVTFYTNIRYFNTTNKYYGKRLFQSNGMMFGDQKIVPLAPFSKLTAQFKFTIKPTPKMKFAYSSFSAEKQYKNYDADYKYIPDGLMNRYEKDLSHILTFTHSISSKTFYELKFIDFSSAYWEHLYKDVNNVPFESQIMDNLSWQADSIQIYNGVEWETIPQYYEVGTYQTQDSTWHYIVVDLDDSEGYVDPVIMNRPAWSFASGGTQGGRYERETNYRMLKFDISSQINSVHQVKTGFAFKRYDLWANDKHVEYLMEGSYGFTAEGDTIGYNPISGSKIFPYTPTIYPTYTSAHSYFRTNPIEFSAYVQDKLELEDLIVNFGLRFDYFDPDWVVPTDDRFPGNRKYYLAETANDTVVFYQYDYPELHSGVVLIDSLTAEGAVKAQNLLTSGMNEDSLWTAMREDYQWKNGYKPACKSYQLSPRIGLSYPVSDKGAIHVSYGYFFQIPNFSYLYSNPEFEIGESNFAGILGNASLKPERTVMYEVGFKQEIAMLTSFDLTLFYRDTRDWVGMSAPIRKYPVGTYFKYENKDYANTRGYTIAINRAFYNGLGASLDYSWMVAEGTYSNPDDAYHSAQSDQEPLQSLIPLDWDQTHTLNGSITYGKRNWSVSMIGKLWSGTPYTPEFKVGSVSGSSAFAGFSENSDRIPNYYELDFRSSYRLNLFGLHTTLFCNIYNLLDIQNERTVWGDTGRGTYTLTAKDTPDATTDRIGHIDEHLLKPDWFSDPRKINVGIHVKF